MLFFPEGQSKYLLVFSKTFHDNVDSKSAQLSQEVLNLKTVSSLLLKVKTLRAFKEMVTNDYHLLVQLPYPTHYPLQDHTFRPKTVLLSMILQPDVLHLISAQYISAPLQGRRL